MEKEMTSIKVPKKLREDLKEQKIHPNQPYYEVIRKVLEEYKK